MRPDMSVARGGGKTGTDAGSRRIRHSFIGPIMLVIVSLSSPAYPADTSETFAIGATDFEFYLGAEGFGLSRQEGMVFGDVLVGFGLIERFSGYIGTSLQADRTLGQGSRQHYLGLFGTPYESDHLDFDLFLDFTGSGSELSISPSLEINWDRDPDMSSYGFYLRAGAVLSHQPADTETAAPAVGTAWEITPALYWTVNAKSQILLEFSSGYLPSSGSEIGNWDSGHVHLGYNRSLHEAVELISEINLELEQTKDVTPWGAFVGVIVTLPTAGDFN